MIFGPKPPPTNGATTRTCDSSSPSRAARPLRIGIGACVVFAVAGAVYTAAPRFYPDDPLWVDDDAAFDASGAAEQEDSNGYDFVVQGLSGLMAATGPGPNVSRSRK